METQLHLPESNPPSTISEVVNALRNEGFEARHDKKNWGDWIQLIGCETVISIESMRGLARMATVEASESDPEDVEVRIFTAFGTLGWFGSDEDGEYPL